MAIVYKNCLHCSEKFPSKNLRAKFCGSACRSAHNRELQKPFDTPTPKADIRVQRSTPQSPTRKPAPVPPTLAELAATRFDPEFERVPVVLKLDNGETTKTNVSRDKLDTLTGTEYQIGNTTHKIEEVQLQ